MKDEVQKLLDMIPDKVQVGGTELNIINVPTIEGGSCGVSLLCGGYIKIAEDVSGYTQTASSKLNTFIHECIHMILDSMGNFDLSRDEKFVNTFAGFATELVQSIIKNKKPIKK